MSDRKDTLAQEISRGARAAALLDDEILAEAFDTLERQYTEAWAGSPVRDSAGREAIYRHLQAVRQVRGHLRTVADTGKLAKAELDALRRDEEAETERRRRRR